MGLNDDEPTRFAFAGDWHGNIGWMQTVVRECAKKEVDLLIHTGDLGVWRDDPTSVVQRPSYTQSSFLAALEEECAKHDLQFWFVEGNHEDYPFLGSFDVGPDGRRSISPHVTHMPRGHREKVDGLDFLFVGGASSVDRPWRREGVDWFPDETLTQRDVRRCREGGLADIIVSHDCLDDTSTMQTVYSKATFFPETELVRSVMNRQRLDAIVNDVLPFLLVHGHYHDRYDERTVIVKDGELFDLKIVGLDCEQRNWSNLSANLWMVDGMDLWDMKIMWGREPDDL